MIEGATFCFEPLSYPLRVLSRIRTYTDIGFIILPARPIELPVLQMYIHAMVHQHSRYHLPLLEEVGKRGSTIRRRLPNQ